MRIYQELAESERKGIQFAVCTVVDTRGATPRRAGSKMLVYEDGRISGSVGGGETEHRVIEEALRSLKDHRTRFLHYELVDPSKGDPGICGGQVEVYVEPVIPKVKVVVVGGGHVGRQVVHLAKWLDYRIVVSDERIEFCNPQAIPEADEFINCKLSELPGKTDLNSNSFLILTTKNADVDIEGLPSLIASDAGYIGVIGSKRRWESTKNGLRQKGIPEQLINKVHSPVGMDIHAETPEEIAVSILAEIISKSNFNTRIQNKE